MNDGMLKELEQYCKALNLLFVEDSKTVQTSIAEPLKMFFNNIYLANNGQEGLEIYKNNDIDLVISDIEMPVMNGIEMTKKIKEIKVNQPIIIVSAYKEFDYIYQLLHLGISAYVIKNGDLEDLFYKLLIQAEHLAFNKKKRVLTNILDDNQKRERIVTPKSIIYPQSNCIEEFKASNKDILPQEVIKKIELKLDKQDIEEAHDLNHDLEQIVGSIFMTNITQHQLNQIYEMLVKFHNTFYTYLAQEQKEKLEPFANRVKLIIDFMETLNFDTLTPRQKESLGLFEFIVEELMKFIDKVLIEGHTESMYYIGKTLDDNLLEIKRELGFINKEDSEITLF